MSECIVCDTCRKVGMEIAPPTIGRRPKMERDWIYGQIMRSNGKEGEGDGWIVHLCSKDCLRRWVETL